MKDSDKSLYHIDFYEDKNGDSELVDYLDDLGERSATSKTARINLDKILSYFGLLERYGTRVGKPVVKHIDGNLWELRPLSNRIFFFHWTGKKFIMLHYFIKKTQKTPPQEIEKARAKMKDFIERNKPNGN